jgi:hypothetical protein
MFHALLSKHNRFLFQFQRDQLINPNDIVDEKDQLNDGEVSSGDEKVDFDYNTLSS